MRGNLFRVAVLLLVAAGCSTTGTPATVPPSSPVVTTTVATTTTTLPPTTTTTKATTTTIDRVAEIEAIFQDLEERRLQALYAGDKETFKTLFANQEYLQRSLGAFDVVEFEDEWQMPTVTVVEVLHDGPGCVAVRTATDFSGVFVGGGNDEVVEVIEALGSGWGMSYAGKGWACEGLHPFLP